MRSGVAKIRGWFGVGWGFPMVGFAAGTTQPPLRSAPEPAADTPSLIAQENPKLNHLDPRNLLI